MKYFDYLSEDEQKDIFFSPPEILDRDGKREMLAYALGAALYMPADKENIYEEIISKKNPSIKTDRKSVV